MMRRCLMMTAVVMGALVSLVPADAGVPLSPAGDEHDTAPVTIDGIGPFDFILDTGADRGAIYPRFAAMAHLRPLPGREELIGGQTGSSRLREYRLGDVVLDGHHFRGSTVVGLPARRDAGVRRASSAMTSWTAHSSPSTNTAKRKKTKTRRATSDERSAMGLRPS